MLKRGKLLEKWIISLKQSKKNIDTLFFNAPGIVINSAKIDGKEAKFTIIKEGVVVQITKKMGF